MLKNLTLQEALAKLDCVLLPLVLNSLLNLHLAVLNRLLLREATKEREPAVLTGLVHIVRCIFIR